MKPNLIIIGSQKCGTSSLHYYLDLHPEVSMSGLKELDFFIDRENWQKGVQWYESQFTGNAKIHGESSPSYTMYPNFSGVPQRMHSQIPDAKLIYIVRDPIERIVSHYLHQWYGKRQDNSFFEVLADPTNDKTRHYINTSSYHLQISQYIEFYDFSQICVVSLEDLKTSPEKTLGKVFRFLRIDDTFFPPESATVVNATQSKMRMNRLGEFLLSKTPFIHSLHRITGGILPDSVKRRVRSLMDEKQDRPELNPQLRQTLQAALHDDIAKFRELTGQSFQQWSM
jgi:hypothetical protein